MTEVHVGVGKCMEVVERVVGEMGSAPVKVGGEWRRRSWK